MTQTNAVELSDLIKRLGKPFPNSPKPSGLTSSEELEWDIIAYATTHGFTLQALEEGSVCQQPVETVGHSTNVETVSLRDRILSYSAWLYLLDITNTIQQTSSVPHVLRNTKGDRLEIGRNSNGYNVVFYSTADGRSAPSPRRSSRTAARPGWTGRR